VKNQSDWMCGSVLTGGGTLVKLKKCLETQILEQSVCIFERHFEYISTTGSHDYSPIQCVGGPREWALICMFIHL
jgi:hypothetical protein